MSKNIALLEQVMTQILDTPETWNQEKWFCGTTACFAGHTTLMSGCMAIYDPEDLDDTGKPLPFASLTHVLTPDGAASPVWEEAESLLGLDSGEANLLFCARNTMEDLQMIVKGFANGEDLKDLKTNTSWHKAQTQDQARTRRLVEYLGTPYEVMIHG